MIFRRPWLVLWLLEKGGRLAHIEASRHRFAHEVWINGLNFLLTCGPLFALIHGWLGPEGAWLRAACTLLGGSLLYGLMVAGAQAKR
jgi:hypothetical protein